MWFVSNKMTHMYTCICVSVKITLSSIHFDMCTLLVLLVHFYIILTLKSTWHNVCLDCNLVKFQISLFVCFILRSLRVRCNFHTSISFLLDNLTNVNPRSRLSTIVSQKCWVFWGVKSLEPWSFLNINPKIKLAAQEDLSMYVFRLYKSIWVVGTFI